MSKQLELVALLRELSRYINNPQDIGAASVGQILKSWQDRSISSPIEVTSTAGVIDDIYLAGYVDSEGYEG